AGRAPAAAAGVAVAHRHHGTNAATATATAVWRRIADTAKPRISADMIPPTNRSPESGEIIVGTNSSVVQRIVTVRMVPGTDSIRTAPKSVPTFPGPPQPGTRFAQMTLTAHRT